MVLNLATQERHKAEFTWVVVISQDRVPTKDGHRTVSWPEIEPATASLEFDVLITGPPSLLKKI